MTEPWRNVIRTRIDLYLRKIQDMDTERLELWRSGGIPTNAVRGGPHAPGIRISTLEMKSREYRARIAELELVEKLTDRCTSSKTQTPEAA